MGHAATDIASEAAAWSTTHGQTTHVRTTDMAATEGTSSNVATAHVATTERASPNVTATHVATATAAATATAVSAAAAVSTTTTSVTSSSMPATPSDRRHRRESNRGRKDQQLAECCPDHDTHSLDWLASSVTLPAAIIAAV